jgi:hypothetical protein
MRLRTIYLSLLAFAFAAVLPAQTVNLVSSAVNPIGGPGFNGKLCIFPANNAGLAIPFQLGGGGVGLETKVCYGISGGALQSGVTVPDTYQTTPQNLCLYTTVESYTAPPGQSAIVNTYPCLQPASLGPAVSGANPWCSTVSGVTTCDLDDYVPPAAPNSLPAALNTVTGQTATSFNCLLKGNGQDIGCASSGTDYATPANIASAVAPLLPANGVSTTAGGNLQAPGTIAAQAVQLSTPLGIAYGGLAASTAQAGLQTLMGAPAFYATNYGARFNALKLGDVTTTAGSPNVTSASHPFTSADVGKPVVCRCGTAITFTGTVTLGSYYISSLTGATGVNFPMSLIGANIPQGTIVQSWDFSGRLIMSQAPTATGTGESIRAVGSIVTTITSVNAGVATLGTNALTSISGIGTMWFGTDDTAAINATIAAASAAGGGTVVIPAGTAMITNYIQPMSHVSFTGLGKNVSILKWASPAGMGYPSLIPAVFFTPNGAPGTSLENVVFTDYALDMSDATETLPLNADAACFLLPYSKKTLITNLYLEGSPASCIRNDFAQDMTIYGNEFSHTGRLADGNGDGGNAVGATYAENVIFPTSSIVANNTFYDCGTTCILYQGTGTNSHTDTMVAVGNLMRYDGFSPNIASSAVLACIDEEGGYYPIIADNICKAQGAATSALTNYGIGFGTGDGGAGGTGTIGGLIEGNTAVGFGIDYLVSNSGTTASRVIGNMAANAGASGCFNITSASGSTPDVNIDISDNQGTNCYGPGLVVNTSGGTSASSLNGLTVKGNKFWDNATGGSGPGVWKQSCIGFTGAPGVALPNVEISSNTCFDDGPGTELYGIGLAANTQLGNGASPAIVKNNNFTGVATSAFYQTSSTTSKVIGINEDNGAGVYVIPSSATPVISFTFGDKQSLTLTAATAPTISGLVAGQRLFLKVIQDSTGGHALTWPAAILGAPAMPQAANAYISIELISYDGATLNAIGTTAGTVTGGDGLLDSSSPTTGNLTLLTQVANCLLGGPSSGSAAAPTCRSLVTADLPANVPNTATVNTFTAFPQIFNGDAGPTPTTVQFVTSTNATATAPAIGTTGIAANYGCWIWETLQTGSQYYAWALCLDTSGNFKQYTSIGHTRGNESFTNMSIMGDTGAATFVKAVTAPSYVTTVAAVTASSTPALVATSGLQSLTLTSNATPTITGIASGQSYALRLCLAGFTWAWPATMVGAPTPPSSGCYTYPFYSLDGTNLTYVGPPPATSPAYTIRTVTVATDSFGATDYAVKCNATSNAETESLPSSPTQGQVFVYAKIDSSANTCTLSGNGKNIRSGSTIATTLVLSTASPTIVQYDSSDGSGTWTVE